MKEYTLMSPEKINYSFNLAGLGSRFTAYLIDSLIQMVLGGFFLIIIIFAAAAASPGEGGQAAAGIIILIVLVFLMYGYSIFFEAIWNGQTPGKKVMKIRVIKANGGAVTFVGVLIRNIMRIIDSLPMAYAVGIIALLASKKSQRLGDMAAGTMVIKEVAQEAPQTVKFTEKEFPWSGKIKLRIQGVTEDEFAILKSYLLRRDHLDEGAYQTMAEKLTGLFAAKMDVELKEIEDRQQFLEQVAAAYQNK
ncbi:MAG: RDD family protein [Clostridia bacterium]|nr:RDD family protein [Clostridia bacterium]